MRLTPPKKITFWIAVVLVVLGLIGMIVTSLGFGWAWLLILAGFILLVLGLLIKGF